MSLVKRFTTRNVGTADRVIRVLPALVFAWVWATGALTGTALIALGVVSAMLFVTAVTARCSIYAMLGIGTCSLSNNTKDH